MSFDYTGDLGLTTPILGGGSTFFVDGALVPAGGSIEFDLGTVTVPGSFTSGSFLLEGGASSLFGPTFPPPLPLPGGPFVIAPDIAKTSNNSLLVLAVPAPATALLLLAGLPFAFARRRV